MKLGKAFEIFVKFIFVSVGFSEVVSDGLYIFDSAPGQMIQGLGEAHNADVLLEPPVQTPFFYKVRLLIECKDYTKKVGLNTIRSALGLREDINHFEMLDVNELRIRQSQRRKGMINTYDRCTYQVALAAMNGYTKQAQAFATTHRIPLIEFDKMPFWEHFKAFVRQLSYDRDSSNLEKENSIVDFATMVGSRMAVAITNSGQMIFLYCEFGDECNFSDEYNLFWVSPNLPWKLTSGGMQYVFQLPENILNHWLENATNDITLRRDALYCKENLMSSMIVYYRKNGLPTIKMISIDRDKLDATKGRIY